MFIAASGQEDKLGNPRDKKKSPRRGESDRKSPRSGDVEGRVHVTGVPNKPMSSFITHLFIFYVVYGTLLCLLVACILVVKLLWWYSLPMPKCSCPSRPVFEILS